MTAPVAMNPAQPRHDRAAIAAAGVRVADAAGLDALTMRRVASELGIATMSLYNYVPAKDHLVQLMIDRLAGEYAYPAGPAAAGHRDSCIQRLIDVAGPAGPAGASPRRSTA